MIHHLYKHNKVNKMDNYINFQEYYDIHTFKDLDEGIRFYKTSKKAKRMLNRAEKRLEKLKEKDKDDSRVKQAEQKIEKFKELIPKFEKLEKEYKDAKPLSKERKEIKRKYKNLFRDNRKALTEGMVFAAVLAGVSASALLASFFAFPAMGIDPTIIGITKRIGVSSAVSSALRGITNKLTDNYQDFKNPEMARTTSNVGRSAATSAAYLSI